MDDADLIARYIEPNPHRPGIDEARLRDFGVSVWALVGYLQAVGNDADRVAHGYKVPLSAVKAALAYYRENKSLIDARLAANVSAVAS